MKGAAKGGQGKPLTPAQRRQRQARVVGLVEALPATVVEPVGERHLAFAVRGKRFAYLLDDHHGDGRFALACKAAPGVNARTAAAQPERYFIPAYVGKQGWLGLRLDAVDVDWAEVAEVVSTAWRLAAPKRLRGIPGPARRPTQ